MGSIGGNKEHNMTFPHNATGRVREDFNVSIFKNGELFRGIPFELREETPFIYTISFNNDNTDFSTWTIVANDSNEPDIFYVETWEVRRLVQEQNVKQIRSRQDLNT